MFWPLRFCNKSGASSGNVGVRRSSQDNQRTPSNLESYQDPSIPGPLELSGYNYLQVKYGHEAEDKLEEYVEIYIKALSKLKRPVEIDKFEARDHLVHGMDTDMEKALLRWKAKYRLKEGSIRIQP